MPDPLPQDYDLPIDTLLAAARERGMRAAFFQDGLGGYVKGPWTFDTIPEEARENYRKMVAAVLEEAAPLIALAERKRIAGRVRMMPVEKTMFGAFKIPSRREIADFIEGLRP